MLVPSSSLSSILSRLISRLAGLRTHTERDTYTPKQLAFVVLFLLPLSETSEAVRLVLLVYIYIQRRTNCIENRRKEEEVLCFIEHK